jgi:XTP/dITP diphosphohydrolase
MSLQPILFASNNLGKLAEVQALVKSLGQTVVSINSVSTLASLPAPAETGETFAANALLKARYYAQAWSGPVLADDSGLAVAALNGAPGIHSNRWVNGSDHDRNLALLAKLAEVGALTPVQRQAQFVTVLCWLSDATAEPQFFTGTVTGTLLMQERGTGGFGYDPLFQPDGYPETFAELGLTVKNTLSHRARALEQWAEFLQINAKISS